MIVWLVILVVVFIGGILVLAFVPLPQVETKPVFQYMQSYDTSEINTNQDNVEPQCKFKRYNRYFRRIDPKNPTKMQLRLHAWLYLPMVEDKNKKFPVIIMAHGFGMTKDSGLYCWAEEFVQAGYAVFVFDHRNFGGSEGVPRKLVRAREQHQDWEAAIEHIVKYVPADALDPMSKIDSSRIAIWGTSFSGAHVISLTSCSDVIKKHVTCAVAQVPFIKLPGDLDEGRGQGKPLQLYWTFLSVLAIGQDFVRSLLCLSRARIKVIGEGHHVAMLRTNDQAELRGCHALLRSVSLSKNFKGVDTFKPEEFVPGASMLETMTYNPLRFAKSGTQIPILYLIASKDILCPKRLIDQLIAVSPNAVLHIEQGSHSGLYEDGKRAEAARIALNFYLKHVPPL
jgi:alpha-beta hydrolase superfamily lysophospholipase